MTAETMTDFTPGRAVRLSPDLIRIVAPNPSAMTYHGTNTYILGDHTVAVIDPGPLVPSHLIAIQTAIGGRAVSHILVTHSHLDHSPLARELAKATGAPVLAFGTATAGRSPRMARLAQQGVMGGGEGIDRQFAPDEVLGDGAIVTGDGWQLTAIHTPGHLGNHLCFDTGTEVFSGDHVMDWATSLVSPPDGDLTDYMASCRVLQRLGRRILWPGHGGPVTDSLARIDWLLAHRIARETQILAALRQGEMTIPALTAAVYTDVAPALWPIAERNVFAHLIDLEHRNLVYALPELGQMARFGAL